MFAPRAAYRWLARATSGSAWRAVTRVLFVALVFGCMVSIAASGGVSLGRAGDGTLNALIVPATQIVALAVLCWRPKISFSRVVELSFTGYGPWLVWMILFSMLWAFLPAVEALSPRWQQAAHYSVFVVVLWSGLIDFAFFREVMQRTAARAAIDLVAQRAIAWPLWILAFGGGPIAAELTGIFRR